MKTRNLLVALAICLLASPVFGQSVPGGGGGGGSGTGCIPVGSSILIGDGAGGCGNATSGVDYLATGAVTSSGLTQATGKLLGRSTAGTGAIQELTTVPATNFPALTGDISNSAGSLTTAIGAAKVTNAMLAGSIAFSKLIGTDVSLPAGAVIGGVTVTLGSDATGDIYYRNASGTLTRLGIGSSGQALIVSSGLPAWGAGGGGSGGDFSSNTSSSVDGEIVLFSGTGGKTGKRATGSGLAKIASGVLGTGVADTDYQVPLTFTSPISRSVNAIACATCVVASSPGVGIAHFAGSTQTVTSSLIVNADITASTIDLTTKVTGILPGANGGTANGFFAISGPASSLKTFAFPNVSATVLTSNAAVTVPQGGSGVATLTNHGVVIGQGTSAVAVSTAGTAGQVFTSNGASADPTFQTITGTGTVTVVGAGSLTSTAFMTGGSGTTSQTPSATSTLDSSGNADFAGEVSAASISFTDTSKSAGINLQGLTSGSVGLAAADIAGTAITYVLPSTNLSANQFLMNSGSTTCPTLNAAMPSTCHLLQGVSSSGSGNVVRVTSATLVTPTLGAALATSINGLTLSSSTGTFALANSKTLTVSNTMTQTATDSSTIAFGAGGTVLYASGNVMRKTCTIVVGADNGSALADADLAQNEQCLINAASTVIEVTVRADAGTPNVIVGRDRLGTDVNLLSGALATAASGAQACSKTTAVTGQDGTTTCAATLQNTSLSAGDWIKLTSGTAGGTAKRMSIAVSYTVN